MKKEIFPEAHLSRKHLNSPVFLSFKVDGQYPLNDARTIFGEQFEKTVEDINATSLFCFGSGEILRENEDKILAVTSS